MNQVTLPEELRQLEAEVKRQLPTTAVEYDEPQNPQGFWWATFFHGGNNVVVEWRPSTGFGVYADDATYSEGPEEVFAHLNECVDNVVSRLKAEA